MDKWFCVHLKQTNHLTSSSKIYDKNITAVRDEVHMLNWQASRTWMQKFGVKFNQSNPYTKWLLEYQSKFTQTAQRLKLNISISVLQSNPEPPDDSEISPTSAVVAPLLKSPSKVLPRLMSVMWITSVQWVTPSHDLGLDERSSVDVLKSNYHPLSTSSSLSSPYWKPASTVGQPS